MDFFGWLILIAFVAIALKVAFWVFVIKAGIDLFNAHQRAFEQEMRRAQADMARLGSGTAQLNPHLNAKIAGELMRAQRELQHMDNLRRESAELRFSSMKADAASLGIFI